MHLKKLLDNKDGELINFKYMFMQYNSENMPKENQNYDDIDTDADYLQNQPKQFNHSSKNNGRN